MSKAGLLILVLVILGFCFSCKSKQQNGRTEAKVYIDQHEGRYRLIRNSEPFYIRGANGTVQLSRLHEIGGNTIRTYDTLQLTSILDEAHANGLAVIVGLPIIRSYHYNTYYHNDSLVQGQYDAVKNTIRKYRDHPALLMWCLGNELNFTFGPKYGKFYEALNQLIQLIHSEDPNHPVTTTIQSFGEGYVANIKWYVPDIDIISINTFGKLRQLEEDLSYYKWFWNGPYIITEWGVNGHWESDSTIWGVPVEEPSSKKAEFIKTAYSEKIITEQRRCLGSLVFFWGSRQEKTDTWYPLITDDGLETQSVEELQYLWTGKYPENRAPVVEYALLNEKGPNSDILLRPGATYPLEVLVHDPDGDSLQFEWYLYAENWYKPTFDQEREIIPLSGHIVDPKARKTTFQTPDHEGAFRVAVNVFDNKGHLGTANVPFYVVK
ncbi:glycoside hydrolase family 2 TIM barrel-domain containing protein [Fulvivirga sedimenti]|uniref:Glycoside hydrolase family 2 catalytic domain-containing protein n=1 Tax=Fulvivirga sedimenti TaxID=2879465 RepID=A0A9X1HUK1_9BACT|nr:glycoside hydrolase family 2 TIM barrel-domain containing protein [Fulvivirga sedimenti]MCA6075547.1 hypothetical protein [Fulvivirga sedimenti]MCA6076724.1 hypothetical protein [Fulvivirga sedimenti]MCA6077852.1 hypothetical protein [Fulvivirga sedimenti]